MQIKHIKILMLLSVLLLSACSAATPNAPTAAPTMDLNILRTEVAATVLAQVPQICALTPTVTQVPTNTVQPTATEAAVTPTETGVVITGTPGTPVVSNDKAKWVSQTVQDDTVFAPGEEFTMTWRIQNVGVTTWTVGYRLRYFSGESFSATQEITLDRDVPPNDVIDISVQMKAPTTVGKYRSDWVMANESLFNFNEPVYLKISVARPSTPTTTATVAPTATSTPQDLTPEATATVQ